MPGEVEDSERLMSDSPTDRASERGLICDDPWMRTIQYGSASVPLLRREWKEAGNVAGYRQTYKLSPGQRWFDAPVSEDQYEALVELDGWPEPVPVGIAIAEELVRAGCDAAYCLELFPVPVFLDHTATCVEVEPAIGSVLEQLAAANGGRYGGMPDVVGRRGDMIIMREAKRAGKDALRSNQESFADVARRVLGDRLDLAVVEWA